MPRIDLFHARLAGTHQMSVAAAADERTSVGVSASPATVRSSRTQLLLNGPIVSTLLRLAWPNVLVMLAQSATGLVETWFVSRLGTDALAGMALVFPCVMLVQMISGGAM